MEKELIPMLEEKEESVIKSLIHTFRGKQVMLDSDIAYCFNVRTSRLNEQMKRNKNRFPDDFCFKLNSEEFICLKSQNAISKSGRGGKHKLPYNLYIGL